MVLGNNSEKANNGKENVKSGNEDECSPVATCKSVECFAVSLCSFQPYLSGGEKKQRKLQKRQFYETLRLQFGR